MNTSSETKVVVVTDCESGESAVYSNFEKVHRTVALAILEQCQSNLKTKKGFDDDIAQARAELEVIAMQTMFDNSQYERMVRLALAREIITCRIEEKSIL